MHLQFGIVFRHGDKGRGEGEEGAHALKCKLSRHHRSENVSREIQQSLPSSFWDLISKVFKQRKQFSRFSFAFFQQNTVSIKLKDMVS